MIILRMIAIVLVQVLFPSLTEYSDCRDLLPARARMPALQQLWLADVIDKDIASVVNLLLPTVTDTDSSSNSRRGGGAVASYRGLLSLSISRGQPTELLKDPQLLELLASSLQTLQLHDTATATVSLLNLEESQQQQPQPTAWTLSKLPLLQLTCLTSLTCRTTTYQKMSSDGCMDIDPSSPLLSASLLTLDISTADQPEQLAGLVRAFPNLTALHLRSRQRMLSDICRCCSCAELAAAGFQRVMDSNLYIC